MIRNLGGAVVALVCVGIAGCASWTNPVANGIPVRLVPPELLAPSKEDFEATPLALLRQAPPDVYRLAPGDLLGIYIEGVLGEEEQLPPVNIPADGSLPASLGYPIVVREDGTLPLPLVDPLKVEGLTLPEAEEAVKRAYTVQKQVLLTGEERILVTLIRPRQTRVLVIRQDSPTGGVDVRSGGYRSGRVIRTGRNRGTGTVVELPAYENDVLTALAKTGGLPGDDAVNEVVIQRGYARAGNGQESVVDQFRNISPDYRPPSDHPTLQVVTIPLRLRPDQEPPFSPEDILLSDGDIVFIEARAPEIYYTAGILPTLEVPLPRDYDLDVVEAITRAGGTVLNGGINANNLQGNTIAPGLGSPSPALLTVIRRAPKRGQVAIRVDLNRALRDERENILVQAGDILVLQETPGQGLARYFTQVFEFGFLSRVIHRTDTTGTTTFAVP